MYCVSVSESNFRKCYDALPKHFRLLCNAAERDNRIYGGWQIMRLIEDAGTSKPVKWHRRRLGAPEFKLAGCAGR